jgi:DNA-binding CsgD family transcriptional regulator
MKHQAVTPITRRAPRANPLDAIVIQTPADIRGAANILNDAARDFGLLVSACADIASKDQIVCEKGGIINADVFGWTRDSERWWEDTRLALSSPLARACRYESEPFWCNESGFYTRWRNRYLEEMDLTNFAKRALCKAAIIVPIHLAFGQIGAVSFIPTDRDETDLSAEFAAHSDFLGALARRFIAGYVSVKRTQQWMPSDCRLSKREVECLRWAAIGKTDCEIGLILSLSHATVRYHVQRAAERLNAVNRSQTIFKAGQLGYLGAAA